MFWRQLTAPEINALDRKIPVVLPLAAIEQHGPHLPVETDSRIAEGFCAATDALDPQRALFLPVQTVGCSEHHLDLGGSLSLTHEAWLASVESIANSVFQQDFKTLVLFNAHGGNQAIGQVAVEKIGRRHADKQVALVTWWKLAGDRLKAISTTGPGGAGHACELETSLMLHFAPESVRSEKIPQRGNRPTYPWAEGDMLRAPEVSFYRDMKGMTADGTYGEPRAATARTGERICECVRQRFAEILESIKSEFSAKH